MIGDMLDVRDNVDWEMWDNQIIKGQQTSYADWPDVAADMSDGVPGMPAPTMRYGNAMTGGTGPVVAGNATIPGGTALLRDGGPSRRATGLPRSAQPSPPRVPPPRDHRAPALPM